jgi:hypothetical protein
MPRGKYPRKPREVQPGVTQEGGVITVQPGAAVEMGPFELATRVRAAEMELRRDAMVVRACSRCLAFEEPSEPGPNGLCRLMPRAEVVRGDGWCLQWKARD